MSYSDHPRLFKPLLNTSNNTSHGMMITAAALVNELRRHSRVCFHPQIFLTPSFHAHSKPWRIPQSSPKSSKPLASRRTPPHPMLEFSPKREPSVLHLVHPSEGKIQPKYFSDFHVLLKLSSSSFLLCISLGNAEIRVIRQIVDSIELATPSNTNKFLASQRLQQVTANSRFQLRWPSLGVQIELKPSS